MVVEEESVVAEEESVVAEEESGVREEESVGEEEESIVSEGENAVQGEDDTMDDDGMDVSTLEASNVLSLLRIEGGDSASTMQPGEGSPDGRSTISENESGATRKPRRIPGMNQSFMI